MYFDVSDMSWMSTENLPRFLVIVLSISRIEPGTQSPRRGLLADQARATCCRRESTSLIGPSTAHDSLAHGTGVVTSGCSAAAPVDEKLPAGLRYFLKEFATGTVEDLQDKSAAR